MTPTEIVRTWIERFNTADTQGLAALYSADAINDQVVFSQPLRGREKVCEMFELEFSRATMTCIAEKSTNVAILRFFGGAI